MRFFQSLLAVFALGGSFAAAAHFRSGAPFLRESKLKNALQIPRGGAFSMQGVVAPPKPAVDSGPSDVSLVRGGEDDSAVSISIPRPKRGYAISLVLSVTYLILMLTKSSDATACSFSQDGFCVTGLVDGSCPAKENSHYWAYQVDCVFGGLVILLGKLTKADQSTITGLLVAVGFHGLLHMVFANNNCSLGSGDAGGNPIAIILGNLAYAAFTAFISFLTVKPLEIPDPIKNFIVLGGTALTVLLSQPTLFSYGVSPIFMWTQILVSLVGVATSGAVNQLMGDLFVMPCIVSIIELVFCCDDGAAGLFNQLGGHVWYDFFLHTSLLATYFPGTPKPIKK